MVSNTGFSSPGELESFSGPRLVSSTARRHGISTSLLFTWRRTYRYGTFAVAPIVWTDFPRRRARPADANL